MAVCLGTLARRPVAINVVSPLLCYIRCAKAISALVSAIAFIFLFWFPFSGYLDFEVCTNCSCFWPNFGCYAGWSEIASFSLL